VQILIEKFEVTNFPARSPDLNRIENLWGIPSRAVYRNNKHYSNIKELEKTL